jgi:dihydrofolate reductase
MRQIIAAAFISLDGVMQAPGGPDEDPTGGFAHGGWVWPYADDATAKGTAENFERPFDLLLGRKTYEIFAAHWPFAVTDPGGAAIANLFNSATKYVASRTPRDLAWTNSRWLGADAVAAVAGLKQGEGPDLLTQGSGDFLQSLLAADLVDELRLLTFPILLGGGKRLFGAGARPAAFTLTRAATSSTGVTIATYRRAGPLRTGSFAHPSPSPAELDRRRNLT